MSHPHTQPDRPSRLRAWLPWGVAAGLGAALLFTLHESRIARMEAETRTLQARLDELRTEATRPIVVGLPGPIADQSEPRLPAAIAALGAEAGRTERSATARPPRTEDVAPALPQPAQVADGTKKVETVSARPANSRVEAAAVAARTEPASPDTAAAAPTAHEDALPTGALVQSACGAEGRVLAAEPQNRRVLLDLGAADAIRSGGRFTLWRDGICVGELRVRTVFADMTVCDVLGMGGEGIRIGDTARELSADVALAGFEHELSACAQKTNIPTRQGE
ncbi:MAG: hypothetical protein ACOCX4_01340 [Planctomycetota bacterium]